MVRMTFECNGIKFFGKHSLGTVVRSHVPLFDYHLPFVLKFLGVKFTVMHPVGLDGQYYIDFIFGYLLVVGSQIPGCISVVNAAAFFDQVFQNLSRVGSGSLEHHMFHEMGNSCNPEMFVSRPHLVGNLRVNNRRIVDFYCQNFQTVWQNMFNNLTFLHTAQKNSRKKQKKDCQFYNKFSIDFK